MKPVLFVFFYISFGLERLGHGVVLAGHRVCALLLQWAHSFWHWHTALISSLLDAINHGGKHARELEKRNVEYLGYVGFASYAGSIALYILSAGPVGRYLTWVWATKLRPVLIRRAQ
ncbi:MAG: hypothetical protein ABJO67_05540 [Pseudoruegeria sp.]